MADKEYLVRGKKVPMYLIGELASAAGKDTVTIRKWEIYGLIPRAALRDTRGQRLYFREEIETLVKVVKEEKPRPYYGFKKTLFKEKVWSSWNKIRKDYLGGADETIKEVSEASKGEILAGSDPK